MLTTFFLALCISKVAEMSFAGVCKYIEQKDSFGGS